MPVSLASRLRRETQDETSHARHAWPMHGALPVAFACWVAVFLFVRWWVLTHGGHVLPWDSAWYAQIAANGYSFDGDLMRQQPVAFLPLFPLTIHAAHALGLSIPASVLVVCISSAAGGMFLLYRALASAFDTARSAAACVLMMANPFSIYFLNGYSEALYFLFFGAFWWALLSRRSFALSALFAGLAGAVRPFGLLLAVIWALALALSIRRRNMAPKRALTLLFLFSPLTVAGFVSVSLYFYWEFGDLFLYRNEMLAWSRDLIDNLGGSLVDTLGERLYSLFHADIHSLLVFAPASARILLWMFILFLPFAARRLSAEIVAYGVGLLFFCVVLTTTGLDLGRHLATNIALPLAFLALVWPERVTSPTGGMPGSWQKALIALLFAFGLALEAVFSARYFHGEWVS